MAAGAVLAGKFAKWSEIDASAAEERSKVVVVTSDAVIREGQAANGWVQELLEGYEDVQAEAEFAEQWQVWLVHFFVGDRRVGFASVSKEGKVLEVGTGDEGGD